MAEKQDIVKRLRRAARTKGGCSGDGLLVELLLEAVDEIERLRKKAPKINVPYTHVGGLKV
jgi:hypothetical protein